MIKIIAASFALVALVAVVAFNLTDGVADDAPHGTVFAENGIAIRGYDPVAYFKKNTPTKGTSEHSVDWQRVTWYFSSKENRDLFDDDPHKYAPEFGGYCAWAVSTKGQAFSIDPTAWRIVDGKLYLNYSHNIQSKWDKDVPGFITTGNDKWPQLKKSLAGLRGS